MRSRTVIKSLLVAAACLSGQLYAASARKDFDCRQVQNVFRAAQFGKTDILQKYQNNKCPKNVTDSSGFSLYDIASLYGSKQSVQWLVGHHMARENGYSPTLYKLLQTGLRFLNHDAGIVNGKMNKATANAIKSFQKSIGQKPTGKPDSAWLSIFRTQLNKKVQETFNKLGFNVGKADGVAGSATLAAIQKFCKTRKIADNKNGYIDGKLVYQLMMAENEMNKKQLLRRRNTDSKPGHGNSQSNPKSRYILKQKSPVAKRTVQEEKQMTAQKYAAENAATEALLKKKQEVRQQITENRVPYKKAVNSVSVPVQGSGGIIPNVATGNVPYENLGFHKTVRPEFQHISGILKLESSGGRLTSCSLSGRPLNVTWCQEYYPSDSGKYCTAVMINQQKVTSLTCK